MFKLIRKHSIISEELIKSGLYDEKNFYNALIRDLKHARETVVIESPYMTCRRSDELLPIFRKLVKRGVKVKINTRFPGHHDELLRIQGWMAYKKLRSVGVKVRLCNDMRHRKLAIIDGVILWEGSLNIMSQCNSREIMRRTESIVLCKQMARITGINRWVW